MNEPVESRAALKSCPRCRKDLDANWLVCPYCGLRLKPGNDLLLRSLVWLGVLLTFVLTVTVISQRDPDAAAGLGMVFGIPLAYVFGKAVLFRLQGTPLTWSQLQNTSFRAATVTFLLLVVVPVVLGVALLLFAFVACGVMLGMGRL